MIKPENCSHPFSKRVKLPNGSSKCSLCGKDDWKRGKPKATTAQADANNHDVHDANTVADKQTLSAAQATKMVNCQHFKINNPAGGRPFCQDCGKDMTGCPVDGAAVVINTPVGIDWKQRYQDEWDAHEETKKELSLLKRTLTEAQEARAGMNIRFDSQDGELKELKDMNAEQARLLRQSATARESAEQDSAGLAKQLTEMRARNNDLRSQYGKLIRTLTPDQLRELLMELTK